MSHDHDGALTPEPVQEEIASGDAEKTKREALAEQLPTREVPKLLSSKFAPSEEALLPICTLV